ncbi:MAG: DNA polymerase III subunit chi [Idiomarinaceae bacterium]|nr:DNA polymerase III subunit chi [Idiomarinaceae bacterium]
MSRVTFFLLPEAAADEQKGLICDTIADLFRQHKKVRVFARSQQQAEQIDELLWQRPADSFIPHNLVGEGPANGVPVEIVWPEADNIARRPGYVLFNLAEQVPAQAQQSHTIFDIVPADEEQKAIARERYKHYRASGCQLTTEPLNAE